MKGQAQTELAPARGLSGLVAAMTVAALAAILVSSIGSFVQVTLAILALVTGAHAVRRLLLPSLEVRLHDGRFEYRQHAGSRWRSLEDRALCFVSPFYIGWRGRRGRAAGLFRGQIGVEEFRRISAHLRQRHGRG